MSTKETAREEVEREDVERVGFGWVDRVSVRSVRQKLLRWYRVHHRRLPWRISPRTDPSTGRDKPRGVSRRSRDSSSNDDHPDPYHVLVSEVMLQQTQVATVIDYYLRFLEAFPTVRALAEASQQRVLTLWQGLGYYRRAKHLHAAAKQIVAEHGGVVPDQIEALIKLPGVGRYTAGAVGSIAFGRRVPVVDGNVTRVLTRWAAIETPPDDPVVGRTLWELAGRVVPPGSPGDFNQALMELGAVICLPQNPRCEVCPVSGVCRSFIEGKTDRIPGGVVKKAPRVVCHHILGVHRSGKYLFRQRPETGLWSGMWGFPTVESIAEKKNTRSQLKRWVHETFGVVAGLPVKVGEFTHQTTHRRIMFVVWGVEVEGGRLRPGSAIWRRVNGVTDLPLPNPQHRAIGMLGESSDR